MRTVLTFDYEIFFGTPAGTARRCVIEPTRALSRVAMRRGAKLVFFVDAGYILRMRAEMGKSRALRGEHDAVCRQVESLAKDGHEIQLHIHPHWEDSWWGEDGWRLDARRYALHAFDAASVGDIVRRYSTVLREIAGAECAFAYRAGGWVIQPFTRLRTALREAGVRIDSTVFAGGVSTSPVQPFDFRAAPAKSRWRFGEDPLVEDANGEFLEVPIASRRLPPTFFWRLALAKKAGGARHRPFADGRALPMDNAGLARKMLVPTTSVVSVDGYKASFLAQAAAEQRRQGREDFVVIGHPKAITPYSLDKLDQFLDHAKEVTTFASYA
jgi:hypothetical protein